MSLQYKTIESVRATGYNPHMPTGHNIGDRVLVTCEFCGKQFTITWDCSWRCSCNPTEEQLRALHERIHGPKPDHVVMSTPRHSLMNSLVEYLDSGPDGTTDPLIRVYPVPARVLSPEERDVLYNAACGLPYPFTHPDDDSPHIVVVPSPQPGE